MQDKLCHPDDRDSVRSVRVPSRVSHFCSRAGVEQACEEVRPSDGFVYR